MKALSLTQPWATLVAIGAKRFETRSWNALHRGWIAIHASAGFPKSCLNLCFTSPYGETLSAASLAAKSLPRGQIIAVARLTATDRTEAISKRIDGDELAFGDYTPGRYAWELDEVFQLPNPVPAKGVLGLWKVKPQDVQSILNQFTEGMLTARREIEK